MGGRRTTSMDYSAILGSDVKTICMLTQNLCSYYSLMLYCSHAALHSLLIIAAPLCVVQLDRLGLGSDLSGKLIELYMKHFKYLQKWWVTTQILHLCYNRVLEFVALETGVLKATCFLFREVY